MRFLAKRTARAIFTIWMGVTLTFVLVRLIPGGPVQQLYNNLQRTHPGWNQDQLQQAVQDRATRMNLYLDKPLWEQYLLYMRDMLQGNMGLSFQYTEPVAKIIGESLPWTLFYVTAATTLVFIIGVGWGSIMAYKEGSILDKSSSSLGIILSAMPSYVLAFALILVFGYQLELLPKQGKTSALMTASLSVEFALDALAHAILPMAAIVLSQAGLNTINMRGNSIQVLGEDYVRVARLRGLADRRIATRYVARNAVLPMYTTFLTLIGFNLGASIVLEQVFSYRGLGWYMFVGLDNRDYALVMGTFLVYTVALVVAVYIADLTYSKIDPRVSQGESSESY
jgi:peptide/nickel transport system permease protein